MAKYRFPVNYARQGMLLQQESVKSRKIKVTVFILCYPTAIKFQQMHVQASPAFSVYRLPVQIGLLFEKSSHKCVW
jgi:hypothetical protein